MLLFRVSCGTWIWRSWYLALRAEAAVLAGHPDAVDWLAAAAAFDAAGSRYQWARTLVFAGAAESTTGAAALAQLGLAPMHIERSA